MANVLGVGVVVWCVEGWAEVLFVCYGEILVTSNFIRQIRATLQLPMDFGARRKYYAVVITLGRSTS